MSILIANGWLNLNRNLPQAVGYPADENPILRAFPPRNKGLFEVDIFFNKSTDFRLEINSDSLGVIYTKEYKNIKESNFPIDISSNPDGRYHINIITTDTVLTKRIRIKH